MKNGLYSIFDKSNIIEINKDSPYYPVEWQKLSGAPEILYGVGNVELLKTRKFCIVGSRRSLASTLKLTAQIAVELSLEFTLVTGTADGGDSAVLEGALKGSGKVISVLAGGFSALPKGQIALLEQVAKKGLVISAHAYETTVRNFSYDYRNKLLARLSGGVLVVSAGETSGALITAKYAEKIGIPLFALPYAPHTPSGEGCNALLKKGAKLVESADDIFQAFGIEKKDKKQSVVLNADEEKILQAIRESVDAHITLLSEVTGMPAFKLKIICTSLEMKGLIASLGGNRYSGV